MSLTATWARKSEPPETMNMSQRPGQIHHVFLECGCDGHRLRPELDRDDRLGGSVDRLQVDGRVVPADHAAIASSPRIRSRHVDGAIFELGRHVPVRPAGVVLQHPQQRRIKFVHATQFPRSAERCSEYAEIGRPSDLLA